MRDQFDTLAWLFKQTSTILIPLSKEDVLLGILAVLLIIVFAVAELWRRTVFR